VKKFGTILLASTAAIGLSSAASAADVSNANAYAAGYSKDPAPPLAPASCTSAVQFIVTDCPLTYYGVTVYGTVDMGGGWESHGTPFNQHIITGVTELVQKQSRPTAMWLPTPNGLTQSNVGVKGREAISQGVDFVFDLNFGFDPYSMQAANGPQSIADNNGIPLAKQNSNADSSRAGQFYNGVGYAGLSSAYGTLTFGRQNSLELDAVNSYDPMGNSYAFSVIGWQGTAVGGGDTEDARSSTAVKYRADVYNWFRVTAFVQMGGYDLNNATQGQWGAGIGKDIDFGPYGKLSFDVIYTEDKGAVKAAALSAAQDLKFPGTLAATISDDNSIMAVAKYSYNQLRVYAGYEYITFANPSNPVSTGFTGIAGIPFAFADITQTAFFHDEHLQIMWTGARYAITTNLDTGIAYYHYDQNSYGKVFCTNASASTCAGTLDAISWNIDWQFAKKFDLYAGVMYSVVHNGLSNGYQVTNNLAPTAGLRFRF
jgi:predicted porin